MCVCVHTCVWIAAQNEKSESKVQILAEFTAFTYVQMQLGKV